MAGKYNISPIMMQFRALRKKSGLSQAEIGNLVGRTEHTIANYETGRNIPNIVMMRKMCLAVGAEGITIHGWG